MENIPPLMYLIITIISSIAVPIIVTSISNKAIIKKSREEIKSIFEKKYNENRWNLYMEFVLLIEEMLQFSGTKHFPYVKFEPGLSTIGTKMMLISSDEFVDRYGTWRALSSVNGIFDLGSLDLLFDLINQLRIDLGNEMSKLDLDRLLKCIVPNYRRSL